MQYLDLSYLQDYIVVCGDIHGDFEALVANLISHGVKDAIVIVAGDCGFGLNPLSYYDTLYQQQLHKKLEQHNILLLMVRGNHDDPVFFEKEIIDFPFMKTLPDYTIVHTNAHNRLNCKMVG